MAGVSGSIIPSPSAPTHPLLESTWANQPTAMIEVVEDTEEVVAAATDEMIVATEEEMRAGDITQGGPHLPITVAVEVDAGGTTDPVPDRIPHVVIEQRPEISWSPGFLVLLLNAAKRTQLKRIIWVLYKLCSIEPDIIFAITDLVLSIHLKELSCFKN